MNERLPIFDELHDARSRPAVARVLLTIPENLLMTYQDAIRRICRNRHFLEGADYVDLYLTALRTTRQADGAHAPRADDIKRIANGRMLAVITEEGEA